MSQDDGFGWPPHMARGFDSAKGSHAQPAQPAQTQFQKEVVGKLRPQSRCGAATGREPVTGLLCVEQRVGRAREARWSWAANVERSSGYPPHVVQTKARHGPSGQGNLIIADRRQRLAPCRKQPAHNARRSRPAGLCWTGSSALGQLTADRRRCNKGAGAVRGTGPGGPRERVPRLRSTAAPVP